MPFGLIVICDLRDTSQLSRPLGGEDPADVEQNGPVFTGLGDSGNELPPPSAEAWTRFALRPIEMQDRADRIDHDAARWVVKHRDSCELRSWSVASSTAK